MNKLYILLLSTMLCVQQTQSCVSTHKMEKQLALKTLPSNDDGYQIQYRPYGDRPVVKLSKEYNEYSEKLYAKDITEKDIEKLIKDGAVLNYKTHKKCGIYDSDWPIPLHFSFDGSKQGVKNMEMLIKHGVALRNLEGDRRPVLSIPLQDNLTDMIQLLIPHENPVVTIYKSHYKSEYGTEYTSIDESEKEFRGYLIGSCIFNQNINSIELLLKFGLATPEKLLKSFVNHMKSNSEILALLREHGAEFTTNSVNQMMQAAFPFDQYIDFADQACTAGAFNAAALERMNSIKTKVDSIVKALEYNASHQEK